jgi:hypothetical protein
LVITIFPVDAPGITIATKLVPVFETAMALTPPMVNPVGVFRFVPVIVTKLPTKPLVGLNEVIVGTCASKLVAKNKATMKGMFFNDLAKLLSIIKI